MVEPWPLWRAATHTRIEQSSGAEERSGGVMDSIRGVSRAFCYFAACVRRMHSRDANCKCWRTSGTSMSALEMLGIASAI